MALGRSKKLHDKREAERARNCSRDNARLKREKG